jgi:pimeloyl-ACP methyl ester carboxylesterase
MTSDVISGTEFQHVIFRPARPPTSALHVYLDGDGVPWRRGRPAKDPTPRDTLVLDLLLLDPSSSVYLGRPCYHGFANSPGCDAARWTGERYSDAVVSSMEAAAREILRRGRFKRVVWIGHSGGGTLAVLLAARFSETVAVVTVAGNLDIDAWADLHGYPRLDGSLNPAKRPPLPAGILQRHYVGDADEVVPKEIVLRGASDLTAVTMIPSYSHRCCWTRIWPTILADLERAIASRTRRLVDGVPTKRSRLRSGQWSILRAAVGDPRRPPPA